MTAIDQDKVSQLLTALRSGGDLDTACHFAGLSNAQVYRWLERGKVESERIEAGNLPIETENEFLVFWDELKKARADAIIRNVAHVQKAAQAGTWKAAAWWLERSVPDVYGTRSARAQGAVQGSTEQTSAIEGSTVPSVTDGDDIA